MPKKKTEMQMAEEQKKKIAEEFQQKYEMVKIKQDAVNENIDDLQDFRDTEQNPYGKGKQKHMALASATQRACEAQNAFIRNMLHEVKTTSDMDYRAQTTGEISRRDLMELIKIRGELLPLWIGYDAPFPGEYVGAIAPADGSKLNEGDSAAAFSKDGNWILVDIHACHSNSRYECRDVDDEKKQLTIFSRSHLIPLPKWKANPMFDKHALFERRAIVLALYPQTTCFYKGIVQRTPTDFREPYQVAFEDDSYGTGFCPPMPVAQKYVVAFREVAGHTASTAPKKGHKKK